MEKRRGLGYCERKGEGVVNYRGLRRGSEWGRNPKIRNDYRKKSITGKEFDTDNFSSILHLLSFFSKPLITCIQIFRKTGSRTLKGETRFDEPEAMDILVMNGYYLILEIYLYFIKFSNKFFKKFAHNNSGFLHVLGRTFAWVHVYCVLVCI